MDIVLSKNGVNCTVFNISDVKMIFCSFILFKTFLKSSQTQNNEI